VLVANIQSNDANSPPRDTAGTRLAAKRAAKSAQKASRKGKSNAVEEATRSVQQAAIWFDDHGKKVWLGLGVLVVLGVAWFALARYLTTKDYAAGNLLKAAVANSHGIVVSGDDTPPEDAIVPTFSSAEERTNKELQGYREVQKKFGDSDAGHYATLGVANSLLDLGKHDEAVREYAKVLTVAGSDAFLRSRALEGSGYALEAQQKYAEALARFEDLGKLGSGAYKPLADYHRARVLVAQGKPADARAVLEASSKALAAVSDEERSRFESAIDSADTLLQELGGRPERPRANGANVMGGPGGGLSSDVLDALRKQLESQPEEQPPSE
jgi:tetratricopeptide (TPR) repeat protein